MESSSAASPVISIIIPEYNQKREYLMRCLNSIFRNQERINAAASCEVILVKDSLDDDISYVHESFPTVKIITTGGATGPGLARQAGLDCASCEWIYFMDSDDSLFSVLSLWYMFEQIKQHPDAPMITFSHYEESQHDVKGFGLISLYCCLFRHSIINKYDIHFLGDMRLYEDMAFVSSYAYAIGLEHIITAEQFPIYYYRDCDSSITKVSRSASDQVSWDIKATVYILSVLKRANKTYLSLFLYWMFRIVNDMGGLQSYCNFVFRNQHQLSKETVSNYNSLMSICAEIINDPSNQAMLKTVAERFGDLGYFFIQDRERLQRFVTAKLVAQ